jgi:hypothetical protein
MSGDVMRKKHSILDLVNIIGGGGGALDEEAALRLPVEFPSSFIWFPDYVCCFGSLKKVNGWMDCSTRPSTTGALDEEGALRLPVEFPSSFIWFPDYVRCFGSLKKVNGWMDCIAAQDLLRLLLLFLYSKCSNSSSRLRRQHVRQ